jgi:hypothetical protein
LSGEWREATTRGICASSAHEVDEAAQAENSEQRARVRTLLREGVFAALDNHDLGHEEQHLRLPREQAEQSVNDQ